MVEPELWALDFMKILLFCVVYTPASINLKQSWWNFVTMYVAIRFQMSLIMDLIGLVSLLELWPLNFKDCFILNCLHAIIFISWPVHMIFMGLNWLQLSSWRIWQKNITLDWFNVKLSPFVFNLSEFSLIITFTTVSKFNLYQ